MKGVIQKGQPFRTVFADKQGIFNADTEFSGEIDPRFIGADVARLKAIGDVLPGE